jgi:membrane-associated phospholipid phosphatase
MIAYGAFTVSNKGLQKVNLAVRDDIFLAGKTGVHRRLPLDDYTLIAPTIAVYGLNIAGVKGKNNFADRTIMYGMANLIGMGISSSVKKMTGVMRPDSSNRLSFPSGHTTKAFIAAEFMRQEYKGVSPWYGIGAYTMAVGTGVLRMYNNKHWLNDVIAGAGVGILSTRLSYWLYPKIKNSFLGRGKGQTMIMPTYENKTVGLGMVHIF